MGLFRHSQVLVLPVSSLNEVLAFGKCVFDVSFCQCNDKSDENLAKTILMAWLSSIPYPSSILNFMLSYLFQCPSMLESSNRTFEVTNVLTTLAKVNESKSSIPFALMYNQSISKTMSG